MPSRSTQIRIGLWTAWVLLVAILILRYWSPSVFYPDQEAGPIYATPNMQMREGVYSNNDQSPDLKMLTRKIRLEPNENYQISFLVKEVTGPEAMTLYVDFFGDNYDFAEQQIEVILKPGIKDKTITRAIPSGEKLPIQAELRIYYFSPTRGAISEEIRVIKESKIINYTFLACIVLIALLSMLYVSVNSDANCTKSDPSLRRLQLLFVFIFLGLIAAPCWLANFNLFLYKPLDENRNKFEKPAGNMIVQLFVEGAEYGKNYEKYFNDSFGFRDLFIKLKNQLDFNLFKRSDEIFIGSDGGMEYRVQLEVNEIKGERLTAQDWEQLQYNLMKLDSYLRSRGITLLLLPIQLKFSIYPELMPLGKISRPEKTAFLRLTEWLEIQPQLHYIDARKILLAAKNEHPVFYKTDFHWNEIGAFFVAGEVVNQIGKLSNKAWRWSHPLQYHEKADFIGGLNRSLGLLYPLEEKQIVIDHNWEKTGSFVKAEAPFEVHFRAEPGKASQLLPKTVVVGNSFTKTYFENNGFYENFSEAYFLHRANQHALTKLLPPDVKFLVYQFIEPEIGTILWEDLRRWQVLLEDTKTYLPQTQNKTSRTAEQ